MNAEAINFTLNRDGARLRIAERILLALCRPVEAPPLATATSTYTLENALAFARRMLPDFDSMIRGKRVLDFGCGHGWQSVAMAKAGADVFGLDIVPELLEYGKRLAADALVDVEFGTEAAGRFDIVVSLGAFEHFADPEAMLRLMLAHGDRVALAFAEPWYSPYGTHLGGTTRVPWLNLWFSEKTLLNVRNLYPDGRDGATKWEEISGGLNKMTVAKFERILANVSDVAEVEHLRYVGVKGHHWATCVPGLRELMTNAIVCVLKRRK